MTDQIQEQKPKMGFNRFLLVYFVTSVLIIAIVGVGFTFKAKQFRDHGPFGVIMEKIVKELDLTDSQKQEIDKIRDEVKAKMEDQKKKREEGMSEFGNLFRQDKLDKEQLMSLSAKHDSQREEMKSFFIDELIKVHDVLTPEQRSKAVDKLKELKGKHEKRLPPGDKHPENQRWDD